MFEAPPDGGGKYMTGPKQQRVEAYRLLAADTAAVLVARAGKVRAVSPARTFRHFYRGAGSRSWSL